MEIKKKQNFSLKIAKLSAILIFPFYYKTHIFRLLSSLQNNMRTLHFMKCIFELLAGNLLNTYFKVTLKEKNL